SHRQDIRSFEQYGVEIKITTEFEHILSVDWSKKMEKECGHERSFIIDNGMNNEGDVVLDDKKVNKNPDFALDKLNEWSENAKGLLCRELGISELPKRILLEFKNCYRSDMARIKREDISYLFRKVLDPFYVVVFLGTNL